MPDVSSGDEAPQEPATETDPSPDAGGETSVDDAPNSNESVDAEPDGGEPEGGEPEGDTADEPADDDSADDYEPEVANRKTAKDFIIERKNRKIKELEKKAQEGDSESADADDATDDVEEDASNLEAMKPIVDKFLESEDKQEIKDFVAENPEFEEFAPRVEKMMKHESRRNIPINELFFAAAGKDLMKIGAQRAKEADKKARDTQAGGSGPSREGMKPKDWHSASKEELEAEKMRVREQSRR